jgi:hypothetical protein
MPASLALQLGRPGGQVQDTDTPHCPVKCTGGANATSNAPLAAQLLEAPKTTAPSQQQLDPLRPCPLPCPASRAPPAELSWECCGEGTPA